MRRLCLFRSLFRHLPAILAFILCAALAAHVELTGCAIAGLLAFALFAHVPAEALPPQKLFRLCAQIPPDEAAWKEFDKRYGQELHAGICRVIGFPPGAKFNELFYDMKQSVYVRLLDNGRRALLAFRGHSEGEARAYLRRVAVSVALNVVRVRPMLQRTPDGLPPETPIEDPVLKNMVNRLSLDQALDGELRGRNKYRNILAFKMHFYDGCPAADIARVLGLGVTARAVENQISRMRKKLQKSLRAK